MKDTKKEILRIAIEGNDTEYVNKYAASFWSEITSSDVDSLINNFDKLSHNQSISLRTLAAAALRAQLQLAQEKEGETKIIEICEGVHKYLEQQTEILVKELN